MICEQRLRLIQKVGKAYNVLWKIPLPSEHLIRELLVMDKDDSITLSIGSDQHHSLSGLFKSIADYLRTHIHSDLIALQK